MPVICRSVDIVELLKRREAPKPGDMWLAPWMNGHSQLSPEYERDWKEKRPPLLVKLPNGHVWCIDIKFSGKNHGWVVTGTPPKITAYPSVNIPNPNGYHGWLIMGVLSDDMEGRTYHEHPSNKSRK